MKNLFSVVMASILLGPITQAQDGWDVDKDAPPPMGSERKLSTKPGKIKQFAFLFYETCELRGDVVHHTGQWTFDILSAYSTVGFEHSESDSLVVLKLRSRSWVAHEAKIWFPKKPFTLHVILGEDTAVFQVDLTAGTFVYVDTTSLLRVESPKEIPTNLVVMQFMNRDNEQARNFAEEVVKKFGSAVRLLKLEEGFYPCLPAPGVQVTNIGRKKSLNETDLGLLVCFQVVDQSQMAAVSTWIGDRQLEEFKRATGDQFGMKGR